MTEDDIDGEINSLEQKISCLTTKIKKLTSDEINYEFLNDIEAEIERCKAETTKYKKQIEDLICILEVEDFLECGAKGKEPT